MAPVTVLNGKNIVLGVTGSIAVYKAADLASKLTQSGARVEVIMTDAAREFVTPLTFQSVTGRAVYTSIWQAPAGGGLPTHIAHVGLGESADLLVIAPATADTIARLASGNADDLLTVTALAARCPVLVAPAMDGGMYSHQATQANLSVLQSRGVTILEPDEGRFASGLVGKGRLPDTATLLGNIRLMLARSAPLAGRRIVVTAGGTRESIDPVRFVTNHSSGKQGHALAQAALDAGAGVTLITAARDLATPVGTRRVPVDTAEEMLSAVRDEIDGADALLMAAAIADYRPAEVASQKIKKGDDPDAGLTLSLARTPDILQEVKRSRQETGWPRQVIGFAAESQNLLENAGAKLSRKGMDMIVANDISAADAGFRSDTNRVVLLDRTGEQREINLADKAAIAEIITARLVELLEESSMGRT